MDLVTVMTRRIPSRIHSSQTEVFRELLACKPAAVTELASLGGRQLLRHLPLATAGVVLVEIYYRCLGAFVSKRSKDRIRSDILWSGLALPGLNNMIGYR